MIDHFHVAQKKLEEYGLAHGSGPVLIKNNREKLQSYSDFSKRDPVHMAVYLGNAANRSANGTTIKHFIKVLKELEIITGENASMLDDIYDSAKETRDLTMGDMSEAIEWNRKLAAKIGTRLQAAYLDNLGLDDIDSEIIGI